MTADTPSPSEVVETERTPNPWPENSDYGKRWRLGYEAGKGDALQRLTPALINAATRTSSPRSVDEATVEAVARAMANNEAARALADKGGTVRFDDMDAQTQDFWRILARVAIAPLPSVAVQPIGER